MTTTLSNGTDTITPAVVVGFASSRAVGAIEHEIIGRPDPDVTFAATRTRRGVLELLFAEETAAAAAEALLAEAWTWTLNDASRPTVDGLRFVVAGGDLAREMLADVDRWLVRVPYREVGA